MFSSSHFVQYQAQVQTQDLHGYKFLPKASELQSLSSSVGVRLTRESDTYVHRGPYTDFIITGNWCCFYTKIYSLNLITTLVTIKKSLSLLSLFNKRCSFVKQLSSQNCQIFQSLWKYPVPTKIWNHACTHTHTHPLTTAIVVFIVVSIS